MIRIIAVFKDLLYLNEFNSIYIGGNSITNVGADDLVYQNTISLPTSGVKRLLFNSFNNYIYVVTNTNVLVVITRI
jgi:hypothetical protein